MKITKVVGEGHLKVRDTDSFWYDIKLDQEISSDVNSYSTGWLFDYIRHESNMSISDLRKQGVKIKIAVEILHEDS